MASNDMASSSVNSESVDEIERVLGSTHDFVDADHPGCDICGQLRDAGRRVLMDGSSEATEDFRRFLAGLTDAKEDFWHVFKSDEWTSDNYSVFVWAAEVGHIVILLFLLGADSKPDGKAKGEALQLAAWEGHSQVVQALLDVLDVDPKVDVHAISRVQSTALCKAARNGQVGIVEAVLKHPKVNVMEVASEDDPSPLHEAAGMGHTGVVEVLLKHPEFDVNSRYAHYLCTLTPLHVAVMKSHNGVVEVLLKHPFVDVNATDLYGLTPFHLAVCSANLNLRRRVAAYVTALLFYRDSEDDYWTIVQSFAKHIDGHILDQEDMSSKTALEYAFESKDVSMWQILSRAEPIKIYIEELFKDRQVYVDSANAILVGAALIASVTFGSWLQPPLSYTIEGDGYSSQLSQGTSESPSVPKYVDVEHNVALRVFWVFNCFSFYFAMATVVAGACSVLPRRKLFIKKIVLKLRRYLIATSILLGCSVLCFIIAFGIAGSVVLAPMLKFQLFMIVPTAIGGLICLIWLGILLKDILEDWEPKDLQIRLPRCLRKHRDDESNVFESH